MSKTYDFAGWATRNDLKCSDGRTIRRDAFKDQDGLIVPLVWNHQHNDPDNVLGHALLQNRPEGVYAYGTFNDTESGQSAKILVNHGDIVSLSIFANKLKQRGGDVLHGEIKEVSLVLAGANPGAHIDTVLSHSDTDEEEAVISFVGSNLADCFEHTDSFELEEEEETLEHKEGTDEDEGAEEKKEGAKEEMAGEKTIKDIFDSLTEEQKNVVYAIIGKAVDDAKKGNADDEGDEEMKHNAFDYDSYQSQNTLTHADMDTIISNARRGGSLKDAFEDYVDANFIQHADDDENPYANVTYGMKNLDVLFPDARAVTNEPVFIKRDDDWVSKFLNGAKHTPFSRIKSMYADITEEDARARGYIKGKQKKDEVFPLFKRVTTPTTIYKKQKFDRDDIIDIDFDAIPWIKSEMRMMLNEEIARAALIGDGRIPSSDDKINEDCIRPIVKDNVNSVYAFTVEVPAGADADATAKNFIRAAIKGRKNYRGKGTPTLWTTTDFLTDMLLLEDGQGRPLYETTEALARKLRVKEIVEVPVMEGEEGLYGIIVNPADYTFGADKGGNVAMFDDFDIDYNQQKYLIETRCSGALTVPKSAMIMVAAGGSSSGPSTSGDGDRT